ncbi:thiamine phosphate synthase [Candidatus Aerophobetes bacterium]|nr:thiamine phosphate synthase [Candidatus Aerophobetes bacterium]
MKPQLPLGSIYLLTDPNLSSGRTHEEVVRESIAGGAKIIQLRDKIATTRKLIEIGKKLREMTLKAGVIFIVNDRVDIALSVDADGVHLGEDDMPIAYARKILGEGKIIGISVDNVEKAKIAEAEGADYIALGPIFSTKTKINAGEPVGVEEIKKVKSIVRLPVIAIGGINLQNIQLVAMAGADSVAVISAVVGAPDIRRAMKELVEKMGKYYNP